MKRSICVPAILITLLVTGCNLLSTPTSSLPPTQAPLESYRDVTGIWKLILHLEAVDNEILTINLIVKDMKCREDVCELLGYMEEEILGKSSRLALKTSFYYPNQELIKLAYDWETLEMKKREVVLLFDTFLSGVSMPEGAMAGHIIIYGREGLAHYLTPEDNAILSATRIGKAVEAGQVTAWKIQ